MNQQNGIDLSKPRYDQSTFWGRLKHFKDMTDPVTLFATNEDLFRAKKLLEDYRQGDVELKVTEDELWEAKKLVDATLHPDTGEKVFLPFRMACFVPTNLIVTAGLLQPNPTIATIILWQWLNQSVNVAFNYFNANKTTKMDLNETTFAYAMAVGSSCTLAVGLNRLASRYTRMKFLLPFVPFVAVAATGVLNVSLMRIKELREGITVFDEHGTELGKSQQAGFDAVSQVAISRIATAFPVLTLPPLAMNVLGRTKMMRNNPRLILPVQLGLITLSLAWALPPALAIFPQRAKVPVERLEPRFHYIKDDNGHPVTHAYFNRGL